MPEDRWDRLAAKIKDAGFTVRLDRVSYAETRYGRTERGVATSVTFQVRDWVDGTFKGVVTISDKYGRGGKWYGWSVTTEGANSIVIGHPTRATTSKSETAASFCAAVATLSGKAA